MKRLEIHLDDETAAWLLEMAGGRNRQSAVLTRLIREAAQEYRAKRLEILKAEVERLSAASQTEEHDDER